MRKFFGLLVAEHFPFADGGISESFQYVTNGDTDAKIHTF